MPRDEAEGRPNLTIGAAMTAAALLAIVAMAHHPRGFDAGGLIAVVHGAMIVLLLILLAGFSRWAATRGLSRPLVLLGLVGYAAGSGAHVVAGTMNGFVAPALVARDIPHDFLVLVWTVNQAFAYLGAGLTSAAFVLWGADLAARGERADRALGIVAIAAGLVPAIALATEAVALDVPGAMFVYSLHLVFSALVGLRLAGSRP